MATASHEYAEAVTDPGYGALGHQTGWNYRTAPPCCGGEIADLCGENGLVELAPEIYVVQLYDLERKACSAGHANPAQRAPALLTENATDVGVTKATLRSSLELNGLEVSSLQYRYGTSTSYGHTSGSISAGNLRFGTSVAISGLQEQTTYHYQVVVETGGGTLYGRDRTFQTLPGKPTVTIGGAQEIGAKSYRVEGSVNPNNFPTKYFFEYRPNGGAAQLTEAKEIGGSGVQPVSAVLSGLIGNTTYEYRLVASNESNGTQTAITNWEWFVTPIWSPVVSPESPGWTREGQATLRGSVDPRGLSTTYRIEYGSTPFYGITAQSGTLSGSMPVPVSSMISGLSPGTNYYYRVLAENSEGSYAQTGWFALNAPRFEAAQYPVTLTAEQISGSPITLGTDGGSIWCGQASLTGSSPGPADTVRLTPSYSECQGLGFLSATITTNGCSYILHAGAHWNSGDVGDFDVSCPEGKAIEVSAATCLLTVQGQSALRSTRYSEGTMVEPSLKTVKAATSASGFRYTVVKDGLGCPLKGAGARENGTFSGAVTIKGANGTGGGASLFMTGEDEGSHAPIFDAESFAAIVTGEQEAPNLTFETEAGNFWCERAMLAGSVSGPGGSLALTPSYSECRGFGFLGGSIAMNGCTYVLRAGEASGNGSHAGAFDVSCPEGKAVELTAASCVLSIAGQSHGSGVEFLNRSTVSPERLKTVLAVQGLRYNVTKDGIGCPFNGTGVRESGSLAGAANLSAKTGNGTAQGIRVSGN